VASYTFWFLVTGQTKAALVHGRVAMPDLPVVRMLHGPEAVRGQQSPFSESSLNHAAAANVTQAAIAASALPQSSRTTVTNQATRHQWKLLGADGIISLIDAAVTDCATDVPRRVLGM
jgi:hypothetical protein